MHREGGCDSVFKGHLDHLVIHNIIITIIDAATVGAGPECFQDSRIVFRVLGDGVAGPAAVFAQQPDLRDDFPNARVSRGISGSSSRAFANGVFRLTDRNFDRDALYVDAGGIKKDRCLRRDSRPYSEQVPPAARFPAGSGAGCLKN